MVSSARLQYIQDTIDKYRAEHPDAPNAIVYGEVMDILDRQEGEDMTPTQTINDTLAERGKRYGDFSDNAEIAEALIDVMHFHPRSNWISLDATKKQGLRYIAEKISRILSKDGDPNYKDNWHDIAGYAKLVEDRCVTE